MRTAPQPIVRALFRLAAGPRLGFGHLVRGRALARALDIAHPCVSLRGPTPARRTAARFGLRLVPGAPSTALRRARPDVLIVDDPSRTAALRWSRAARALGVPVVSVHDLGLAFCEADLSIDGSVVPSGARPGTRGSGPVSHGARLAGPSYAILDPSIRRARGYAREPRTVLIALGGGPRIGVALRIARALRAVTPEMRVRIAGGFAGTAPASSPGIVCLGPCDGLAGELGHCAVAITGGGVSLYEAAALDTPAIAWPVVRAQHRTAAAFHRRGLATAVLPGADRLQRAVTAVHVALALRSPRATSATIDGLGAARVADAIRALLRRRSREAA